MSHLVTREQYNAASDVVTAQLALQYMSHRQSSYQGDQTLADQQLVRMTTGIRAHLKITDEAHARAVVWLVIKDHMNEAYASAVFASQYAESGLQAVSA